MAIKSNKMRAQKRELSLSPSRAHTHIHQWPCPVSILRDKTLMKNYTLREVKRKNYK